MKRFTLILLMTLGGMVYSHYGKAQCSASQHQSNNLHRMPQGFSFEKSYDVTSENLSGGKAEYDLTLAKGTLYLLNVSNYRGEEKNVVVELYDKEGTLIATNYNKNTDRYYPLGYACRESGGYKLVFTFKDTEKLCGLGVLALRK